MGTNAAVNYARLGTKQDGAPALETDRQTRDSGTDLTWFSRKCM